MSLLATFLQAVLGCFYFYPMGFRTPITSENNEFSVDVSWWVTQEMHDQGFYKTFFEDIKTFLKEDWLFLNPYFSNKIMPE